MELVAHPAQIRWSCKDSTSHLLTLTSIHLLLVHHIEREVKTEEVEIGILSTNQIVVSILETSFNNCYS